MVFLILLSIIETFHIPMNFITRKFAALKEIFFFSNWPILLVGRLPVFEDQYAIYRKGRVKFITDYKGGDATGARHLLASNLYGEFIDAIKQDVQSIDSVLDVGANNGGFILYLFQHFLKPISKIVAVEYNYRTFLRLQFNILYNTSKDTDINLINAAGTGKNGWLQAEDNYGSTGNSIYDATTSNKTIKLPTITFDHIYEEYFKTGYISICKIDIEGAEYEFLNIENSKNLTNVKYLIIEIHVGRESLPESLIANIVSRGFTLLIGGNYISPEVYLFKNTVLI